MSVNGKFHHGRLLSHHCPSSFVFPHSSLSSSFSSLVFFFDTHLFVAQRKNWKQCVPQIVRQALRGSVWQCVYHSFALFIFESASHPDLLFGFMSRPCPVESGRLDFDSKTRLIKLPLAVTRLVMMDPSLTQLPSTQLLCFHYTHAQNFIEILEMSNNTIV